MKYLLKYNSFENDKNTLIRKKNEEVMLPSKGGISLFDSPDPLSPEEKLTKKYLSTKDQDIEDSVPWYKFGKSKQEFIEKEKKNREIFLNEKKRFKEETLKFDAHTLVYEFFKNLPEIDVESQKKVNVLKARFNPKNGYCDDVKRWKMVAKISEIYMDKFKKMSASKIQKLETTRKDILKLEPTKATSYQQLLEGPIYDIMDIIFYKSTVETNFDLEKYKPVPPTPIDPDLLKKINDYEIKKAQIKQSYKDQEKKELEEWRERERKKSSK
jgi:hypothetical protein